jgi:hypothetical protein
MQLATVKQETEPDVDLISCWLENSPRQSPDIRYNCRRFCSHLNAAPDRPLYCGKPA